MPIPVVEPLPSIGEFTITCAVYATLGYALARLRWWASIPFLLFLAITLLGTLKRLEDLRAAGPLSAAIPPHILRYRVLEAALAAAVIVLGMRQQQLARRRRQRAGISAAAV